MNWKLVVWVAAGVITAEAIAWGVFGHSTTPLWLVLLIAALVSLIAGGLLAYMLRPRNRAIRAIDNT